MGRGSPAVHGVRMYADQQGSIVVARSDKAKQYQELLLELGKEQGTIAAPQNSSLDLYFSLQGPSGKGEFRLERSMKPGPWDGAIGMSGIFDRWNVKNEHGMLFLRNKALADSGFWIAVPEEEEGVWAPWWYSPNSANLEDFASYVMIDIELIKSDAKV
jgi:hypothetical protein